MKRAYILVVLITAVSLFSCEKDELKLPSKLNIEFDMDAFSLEDAAPKGGQLLVIDESSLIINTIEFDGKREQGDDYFFASSFEIPVEAQMHTGSSNQNISFDIPQGIYNNIEMNIKIGDKEKTALRLKGKLSKGPFEDIPVVFEYSFSEEIRVRAEDRQGNRQIIMRKDRPSTAQITMDAPGLCRLLNMGMIMMADQTVVNGEQMILINNTQNTEIFNIMATRLDQSLRVIFE